MLAAARRVPDGRLRAALAVRRSGRARVRRGPFAARRYRAPPSGECVALRADHSVPRDRHPPLLPVAAGHGGAHPAAHPCHAGLQKRAGRQDLAGQRTGRDLGDQSPGALESGPEAALPGADPGSSAHAGTSLNADRSRAGSPW